MSDNANIKGAYIMRRITTQVSKNILGALLANAAIAGVSSVNAAEGFGDEVAQVGQWTIYAKIDGFTDAKTCVALFQDRADIQMDNKSFAISFRGRGGISAYKYRLDNQEPTALELASRREKGISALIFEGTKYNDIVGSTRLRLQAFTALSTLIDEDIDMTEAQDALDTFAANGCK